MVWECHVLSLARSKPDGAWLLSFPGERSNMVTSPNISKYKPCFKPAQGLQEQMTGRLAAQAKGEVTTVNAVDVYATQSYVTQSTVSSIRRDTDAKCWDENDHVQSNDEHTNWQTVILATSEHSEARLANEMRVHPSDKTKMSYSFHGFEELRHGDTRSTRD